MEFKYPLELAPGEDGIARYMIAVQDDEGKITYEPVTAAYRQGEKVVIETDRQQLRLDPGLKVQSKSALYQSRPGRTFLPRATEEES